MLRWNTLKTVFNCTKNTKFTTLPKYSISAALQLRNPSSRTFQLGQLSTKHLHTSSRFCFKDEVTLHFFDRNGIKISVQAEVGDNILDVAKDADIDGVEGACGGTLACSTCHCIFKQEDFDRLGLDDISEDELDMLDLAFGLSDTSRLVCAIDVEEEMDGIEVTVPIATNDARD